VKSQLSQQKKDSYSQLIDWRGRENIHSYGGEDPVVDSIVPDAGT